MGHTEPQIPSGKCLGPGGPLPPGGGTVRHPARVPLADLPPQRRPPPPGQREVVRRVDEGRPEKLGLSGGGRGRHPGPEMRPRSGRVPAAGAGDPAGLSHAQGELDHPSPGRLREGREDPLPPGPELCPGRGKTGAAPPCRPPGLAHPGQPQILRRGGGLCRPDIIRWKQSSRVAVGGHHLSLCGRPRLRHPLPVPGGGGCTSPSAAPGGRCGWTM